ncbi:MAG: membrane protein insertion efficiency factor YidD [Campylobacterales bacterium]
MRFEVFLIDIYKKYISPLFGSSCRYYPSCSEYARIEFINSDSMFFAFWRSASRLLRCNQLFSGGIDHPIVYKKIKPCFGRKKIKYWLIPTDAKSRYRVVKNLSS